ncbi:MAG: hypothetical protein M5R36_29485 [Deltaproteobacteria bacterium]|nr:hypothetical protein [Deltaproteobacteria bacterium]
MRGFVPRGDDDAALIFEPRSTDDATTVWNQDNYEGHTYSPFVSTQTGTFDITADDKPVTLPMQISVTDCGKIIFRGIKFEAEDETDPLGDPLRVNGGSQVETVYCRFEERASGVQSFNNSVVDVQNCYFQRNLISVYAGYRGAVNMVGNNYIVDPYKHAVLGWMGAQILVSPWDAAWDYYTTHVLTPIPKVSFKAVRLVGQSRLTIWQGFGIAEELLIGKVKIYNQNIILPPEYLCVVLESQSMVTGSGQFEFLTLNAKGEDAFIPAGQTFVSRGDQGCLILP